MVVVAAVGCKVRILELSHQCRHQDLLMKGLNGPDDTRAGLSAIDAS